MKTPLITLKKNILDYTVYNEINKSLKKPYSSHLKKYIHDYTVYNEINFLKNLIRDFLRLEINN